MIRTDFFDESTFRYALYEVNDLLYLKHIRLIFCLYVKKGNLKILWTLRKKRRHTFEVQISSIRIWCQDVIEITVYLTLFCGTFFYCGIGCIRYGKCISVYLLTIVYLSRFYFSDCHSSRKLIGMNLQDLLKANYSTQDPQRQRKL